MSGIRGQLQAALADPLDVEPNRPRRAPLPPSRDPPDRRPPVPFSTKQPGSERVSAADGLSTRRLPPVSTTDAPCGSAPDRTSAGGSPRLPTNSASPSTSSSDPAPFPLQPPSPSNPNGRHPGGADLHHETCELGFRRHPRNPSGADHAVGDLVAMADVTTTTTRRASRCSKHASAPPARFRPRNGVPATTVLPAQRSDRRPWRAELASGSSVAGDDPVNGADPSGLCNQQGNGNAWDLVNPWSSNNPIRCSVEKNPNSTGVKLVQTLDPAYTAISGYTNEWWAAENGCGLGTELGYGAEGVVGVAGSLAIAGGGAGAVDGLGSLGPFDEVGSIGGGSPALEAANQEMTVQDYASTYMKGSAARQIPGEFMNMSVKDALESGNTTVRKLLTALRFQKG